MNDPLHSSISTKLNFIEKNWIDWWKMFHSDSPHCSLHNNKLFKTWPGVNVINILLAHFLYKSLLKAKLKAVKSCSKDFCMKNVRIKCWWNWLQKNLINDLTKWLLLFYCCCWWSCFCCWWSCFCCCIFCCSRWSLW